MTLYEIRKTFYFDALESMAYHNYINSAAHRLEYKLNEAKVKNANLDYTEQENVINELNIAARWMQSLYAKFERQNTMLYDFKLLNDNLQERIVQQQKIIETTKLIDKF